MGLRKGVLFLLNFQYNDESVTILIFNIGDLEYIGVSWR